MGRERRGFQALAKTAATQHVNTEGCNEKSAAVQGKTQSGLQPRGENNPKCYAAALLDEFVGGMSDAPPRRAPPLFSEVQGKDAILNFIFNPSSFIGVAPRSAAAASSPPVAASATTDAAASPEELRLKAEEKRAVDAAEADDLEGALAIINGVLASEPGRPTALNNRAQIHRLQGNAAAALDDLNAAIDTSGKWLVDHPAASVMEQDRHRRVLQQSHMQRAILHKDAGNDAASAADVELAASHGSRLARMMTSEVQCVWPCESRPALSRSLRAVSRRRTRTRPCARMQ